MDKTNQTPAKPLFLNEIVGKGCNKHIEKAFEILILRKGDKPFNWYKFLELDKGYASKIRRGLIIPPLWLRIRIAEYFKTDSTTIWREDNVSSFRQFEELNAGKSLGENSEVSLNNKNQKEVSKDGY